MRETIYKELAAELQQIRALKWIDWDFGQLSQPAEQYPVPLPAVLLSFGAFNYSDLPSRVQEGEATIYLDLYLRRVGDLQANAPKQAQTLEGLCLLDEISERLHAKWQTERIQALHRRSEQPIDTPPDLLGVRQTYEARLLDTHMTTAPERRRVRLVPKAFNETS